MMPKHMQKEKNSKVWLRNSEKSYQATIFFSIKSMSIQSKFHANYEYVGDRCYFNKLGKNNAGHKNQHDSSCFHQ